jgi:tetratricopeptide (TPR) repeat protein
MLKTTILFVVGMLFVTWVLGQEGEEKVKALIDKAYGWQYSDNDSAKHFANEAIKLAKSIDYNDGLVSAYVELGYSYKTIGEMDSALYIFNKGLALAIKPSHKSVLYSEIASTYKYLGDFDKSIYYYQNV